MDDSVAAVGWDADGFVATPIFGLQLPSAIDIAMIQKMWGNLAEKCIPKIAPVTPHPSPSPNGRRESPLLRERARVRECHPLF